MSTKDYVAVVDVWELFTLVVFFVTGTLLLAIIGRGVGLVVETLEQVALPKGVLDRALVIRARPFSILSKTLGHP